MNDILTITTIYIGVKFIYLEKGSKKNNSTPLLVVEKPSMKNPCIRKIFLHLDGILYINCYYYNYVMHVQLVKTVISREHTS